MNANKIKSVARFIKEKKYYLAVTMCILTVGAVGLISYNKAQNIWDDTTLPENTTLDAEDASIPQENTPADDSLSASKPTKQPESAPQKAKEYILPVDGTIDVGYSEDTPIYSKTLADWRTHSGIDYVVALGTEVKAVNDGVVEKIVTDDLMGTSVTIRHTDGYASTYANLENGITLKKDQLISQGDTVGKVGKSAIIEVAQEPHLHFEVSYDGKTVDPLKLYGK